MGLRKGAETIVNECLDISGGESVVVLNDGNDQDLIDSLLEVLEKQSISHELLEYKEPENHGEEPPGRIAEAMKDADVFIAPTKKSLSHTEARLKACETGSRGATLPGIDREVWNASLQADYHEVKRISEKVYSMLEDTDRIRIETPSGTELEIGVNIDYFHTDTGLIHEPGEFGNLPAGETDGGVLNVNGTLVIDRLVFDRSVEGARVEIENSEVKAVRDAPEDSELLGIFDTVKGARNIAEFGFGTNPEAILIGNLLQDEKVLGTVHVAFGTGTTYAWSRLSGSMIEKFWTRENLSSSTRNARSLS